MKKINWILLGILGLGLFLRLYKGREMFLYAHDQDLAGWMIKDILVNKHFRLIGQLTSTPGIFIGPYFYYYLIPFYLLFRLDPLGGFYAVVVLGMISISSFYFVLGKVFKKSVGYIGAFLYTVSIYTMMTDRWMVPTMPVFLWSVWLFYSVFLILNGKRNGYVLAGILVGLIWDLSMALILTVPVLFLAFILSKKKLDIIGIAKGLILMVVVSLPLIIFEVKHNFIQSKAFIISLTTTQNTTISGISRFEKVLISIGKTLNTLFTGSSYETFYKIPIVLMTGVLIYLILMKVIKKQMIILIFTWVFLFIVFFASYSKLLSEYYLDGIVVIWIVIASLFIKNLIDTKKYGFALILLTLFTFYQMRALLTYKTNLSGYIERKVIVSYINQDRVKHSYPCVAVSYITSPGNDLGYRYLFWLERMHVNKPVSGSPVYTIVFPLSLVDRVNYRFGGLGLILPDYNRYNDKDVDMSCSGANSNLTDPMFGYTE